MKTESLSPTNLIDKFMYLSGCTTGQTEVPEKFWKWCGISLIAAAVSDRVYIRRSYGRVAPNLYTFLVAPSGVGKGQSMGLAKKVLDLIPKLDYYNGRLTGAFLTEYMTSASREKGQTFLNHGRLYLMQPELSMGIGEGALARPLLQLLTEIYTGGTEGFRDGTIGRGQKVIESCCLNWQAGTNPRWLSEAVSTSMIEGGFFARLVIALIPEYDFKTRIPFPEMPEDFDDQLHDLAERLKALMELMGEMKLSPEAAADFDTWYLDREPPKEDLVIPTWQRQPETVLKLATILSLADGDKMWIESKHMLQAIELSQEIMVDVGWTIDYLVKRSSKHKTHLVEEQIYREKRITHSTLLKRVYRRNVDSKMLRDIIKTLEEAGKIGTEKSDTGGKIYVWNEEKGMV